MSTSQTQSDFKQQVDSLKESIKSLKKYTCTSIVILNEALHLHSSEVTDNKQGFQRRVFRVIDQVKALVNSSGFMQYYMSVND